MVCFQYFQYYDLMKLVVDYKGMGMSLNTHLAVSDVLLGKKIVYTSQKVAYTEDDSHKNLTCIHLHNTK